MSGEWPSSSANSGIEAPSLMRSDAYEWRSGGQSERLLRFYGALVERYALQTLQQVHPEPRLPGSGRVSGDRPYGPGNGKRSPDICVDCGSDLVLIEVTSGRFTIPTLVEGDPEKAARDLTRLLWGKLDQLGGRIDDLLAGDWSPPDVDLNSVERIWPVLVTADILQNDLLWQEISARMPQGLTSPGYSTSRCSTFPTWSSSPPLSSTGSAWGTS
jgi:hypothetical protein